MIRYDGVRRRLYDTRPPIQRDAGSVHGAGVFASAARHRVEIHRTVSEIRYDSGGGGITALAACYDNETPVLVPWGWRFSCNQIPGHDYAIVNRAALADALIDGRGVQELDAKGKAANEIKAVWRWIKRRI